MNPPLSQADATTQLKIFTSQTGNFTFTDDEISQAIQSAWNDPFVVDVVTDSSLTYTDGVWEYGVPDGMTTVREIYTQRDTSSNPDPISSDLYEVVDGVIRFRNEVRRWLTTGQILYLKGTYKLDENDELDTNSLVNYVINLGAQVLLNNLILKATFTFLKNDITVSDITRALGVVQNNVIHYKQAIIRQFEGA